MTTTALLDTPAILAGQATQVHLLLRFTAPPFPSGRTHPIAFAAVIDRSGSMAGAPLHAAREAARAAVRLLRPQDQFAVVAFDSQAQVIIPLQKPANKDALLGRIATIENQGSTNLTAGWMLGRDELLKADAGVPKRLLLLSDGCLNNGITDPAQVQRIVADGLEKGGIRTTCLGFGGGYDQRLLADLSGATGGTFYDANAPEKLPAIFQAELDTVQATVVQNLRLRIRRTDFCERVTLMADYPILDLPDGRAEITIGDLSGDEERTLVALLDLLPIPRLPTGEPAATLEGESLLELEAAWDVLGQDGVTSAVWTHTVRVTLTPDPGKVTINPDVIPWVAQQRAAKTVEDAMRLAKDNRVAEARARLLAERERHVPPSSGGSVHRPPSTDLDAAALALLDSALADLETSGAHLAESKARLYSTRSLRRMSSAQHWTADEPAPKHLKRRPTPPPPTPPPPTP